MSQVRLSVIEGEQRRTGSVLRAGGGCSGESILSTCPPFSPVPRRCRHLAGTKCWGCSILSDNFSRDSEKASRRSRFCVRVQGVLLPRQHPFVPPTFRTEHAGFDQELEAGLGLGSLAAFAAKGFSRRNGFWSQGRASRLKEGSFSEALL